MKASLFTPTNDTRYLVDAHNSLRKQSVDAFEWVIVPNDGAVLPAEVAADPRVRAFDPGPGKLGIGALKKFAASKCTGDLLVEFDHDDLLAEGAVERLLFHAHETGAGFLYSDFVSFNPDGTSTTYAARHGWETYPATYDGDAYEAMRSFDADARSLHQLWYCPNHVRAWTRDAYALTGGHDPTLPVADDHDLICRTYLKGVKFHHIEEPLYWYRERQGMEKNTYRRSQEEIARLRDDVMNKYTHPLVFEWTRRHELGMVDLTAGAPSPRGFTSYGPGRDAEVPWEPDDPDGPFTFLPDNSVGCVRAFEVLHQVPQELLVPTWNEIYRVLAPGGWLLAQVPSTDGRGAFCDPRARSFWNANSWWPVTKRERQESVGGLHARFQVARAWESWPTQWHQANRMLIAHADLVCLKGQRSPGLVEI